MTLITTSTNALTLTIRDIDFPLVIETEVVRDGVKRNKKYSCEKKDGGLVLREICKHEIKIK